MLLFGKYRTKDEVASMEEDDKRNTLIMEMEKKSSHSLAKLQGFSSTGTLNSLVGLAFISIFLESNGIRTKEELSKMSYDDQRNTLIVFLNKNNDNDNRSFLQSLGDFHLVQKGFKKGNH